MGLSFVVIIFAIVFSAVWGSIFLTHLLRGSSQRLEPGDDPRVTQLQEETEDLQRRLAIVEEELDFFKELRAPSVPDRLPPADTEHEPS